MGWKLRRREHFSSETADMTMLRNAVRTVGGQATMANLLACGMRSAMRSRPLDGARIWLLNTSRSNGCRGAPEADFTAEHASWECCRQREILILRRNAFHGEVLDGGIRTSRRNIFPDVVSQEVMMGRPSLRNDSIRP